MDNVNPSPTSATSISQRPVSNVPRSVFPSIRDQTVQRSATSYSKADVEANTFVSSSRNKRRQTENQVEYSNLQSQLKYSTVMSSQVAKPYGGDYTTATSASNLEPSTSHYRQKTNVTPSPYSGDWSMYDKESVPTTVITSIPSQSSHSSYLTGSIENVPQTVYNTACVSTYTKAKNSCIYNSLSSSANKIRQMSIGYQLKTSSFDETDDKTSTSLNCWNPSPYGRDSYSDTEVVSRSPSTYSGI